MKGRSNYLFLILLESVAEGEDFGGVGSVMR
jgi:hypothetical protein